jgi:CDP-paratose 2-epimerase
MKYLITGGCGFIGTNLAAEVLNRNGDLVLFDNLFRIGSSKNLEWLKLQGEFEYYPFDIRNYNDVDSVIRATKPDIIFHMAGQVAMTTSLQNPRIDFETNTLGTHNLLEAVRKHSDESIILYSSTNKVYGDLGYLNYSKGETRYTCDSYPNGFDEKMQLDFHSPYGCSKGAADQYLLDYFRMFSIRTVVFRHSTMFGGHQNATYDQGWVGWFAQKAIEIKQGISSEPFTISGNGKQVRDVLHSDDVVDLYFKAFSDIDKTKGEVFNIGGGYDNSLSLVELFSFFENNLDIKMVHKCLPERISDQKVFIADIKKINNTIGWNPKVDKFSGIQRLINCMNDSKE